MMHSHLPLGDLGTWVGAIATSCAVIFALIQLAIERYSRARDARLSRAASIAAWIVKPYEFPMGLSALNSSNEPVYQVILTLVSIQGGGPPRDAHNAPEDFTHRTCLSVLPPGRYRLWMTSGGHGMGSRYAVEVCFTDASGRNWVRKGNGRLKRLRKNPVQYYKLRQPIGWLYPEEQTEGMTETPADGNRDD